jgi:hypothetical protein
LERQRKEEREKKLASITQNRRDDAKTRAEVAAKADTYVSVSDQSFVVTLVEKEGRVKLG